MKVMKQTETNIPKKSKKSDKNSNANWKQVKVKV
jgi:hypothetical protein